MEANADAQAQFLLDIYTTPDRRNVWPKVSSWVWAKDVLNMILRGSSRQLSSDTVIRIVRTCLKAKEEILSPSTLATVKRDIPDLVRWLPQLRAREGKSYAVVEDTPRD